MQSIFLAILFGIIANSFLYIGLVLEKKGASELPNIENTGTVQNILNFVKNPRWLWGFIMTNIQMLFYWLALAFGPISLVSPMLGVGLIVLIIFSRYYLGEKINKPMYFGILVIIIGIAMLGATSKPDNTTYTYSQLLTILVQPNAIIINVILILGSILPVIICTAIKYRYADILCGIGSGFANAFGAVYSKFMVAGINLGQWEFYVFLILLIIGNTASMVIQQLGFQKGQAVGLVPMYTVLSLILPALVGVWLFDEWLGNSSVIVSLNVIAMIAVSVGTVLLAFFNAKQESEKKQILVKFLEITES